MTDGFGAGFFVLALLVALGGTALVLALLAVVAVVVRRRTGRVPTLLRYLAVAVLAGVVVIAGFGVLALYDEAPVGAGLLVAVVLVPLAAATVRGRRATDLGPLDVLAATALAWGFPCLAGVVLFFALDLGVAAALDLAPAEAGRLAVSWAAVAGSGLAAVAGTVLLAERVAEWLASERTNRSRP